MGMLLFFKLVGWGGVLRELLGAAAQGFLLYKRLVFQACKLVSQGFSFGA